MRLRPGVAGVLLRNGAVAAKITGYEARGRSEMPGEDAEQMGVILAAAAPRREGVGRARRRLRRVRIESDVRRKMGHQRVHQSEPVVARSARANAFGVFGHLGIDRRQRCRSQIKLRRKALGGARQHAGRIEGLDLALDMNGEPLQRPRRVERVDDVAESVLALAQARVRVDFGAPPRDMLGAAVARRQPQGLDDVARRPRVAAGGGVRDRDAHENRVRPDTVPESPRRACCCR